MKQDKKVICERNRMNYITPSKSNYSYRERNAIYISTHNSIKHELSKCLGAYMLKKYGDLKFSYEVIYLLTELDKQVNKDLKEWIDNDSSFVTEAVPRTNTKRQVDLVDLYKNVWFEFETDRNIKKKDCITIYI